MRGDLGHKLELVGLGALVLTSTALALPPGRWGGLALQGRRLFAAGKPPGEPK